LVIRKILITNKKNTIFTIQNNVFENMEGDVNSPSIKQKALRLIGNTDDPNEYCAKLGSGILYVKRKK